MTQKEMEKENSEKAVLTQIQNQAIIVSSQCEVKSQLQAQSQDRVPYQVQDSQGQVATQAQLASQNNVPSQVTVASQDQSQTPARLASQTNVSSQENVTTPARSVSSQPTVPTLSQISSQRSVSSSQGAVLSQKRKGNDIIADMPPLTAVIKADQQSTSSENSQDVRQKSNE